MIKLTELLNIKYPILQGAMAQVARFELVSAVSNAGGLGIIASGGMSAESLREQIREVKSRTDKAFGVNLMLMNDNIPDLVDVIIEEKVPVVTTGAGSPKNIFPKLRDARIVMIPVVPSVKIAKKMEELGVPAIITEGQEAGGHIGEVSTLPLVRQAVKNVNIPVIAAGGIADGASIASMFAIGASGVQIGSLFLTAEECPISHNFKQAVLNATEVDTRITGLKSGHPVRGLANELTEKYIAMENECAPQEELEKLTRGSLRRAVYDGDDKWGSLMCGQGIGQITSIRTCQQIIDDLVSEYKESVKNIPQDI